VAVFKKKDKTCKVTTDALNAFNVYTMHKQQGISADNTIDFNNTKVQKDIADDAVN